VLGCIVLALATSGCGPKQTQNPKKNIQQTTLNHSFPTSVCFDKTCFDVELAITKAEHQQGLMNRKTLQEKKGLLFIFKNSGNYPFWMKNTLIPLDIIWINKDLKIVHIAQMAIPLDEKPIIPAGIAKFVLEINGGLANSLEIREQQTVTFR